MEVEYTPTVDDIIALHREHAKRTKGRQVGGVIMLIWLIIPLAILGSPAVLPGPPGQPKDWIALTGFTLALIGLILLVFRDPIMVVQIRRRARLGEFDRVCIPQKLVLSPEGVTHSSENGVALTLWKAIVKVRESEDHAFIYLSQVTAYVVPRYAFPNDAAFENFIDTARDYHRA